MPGRRFPGRARPYFPVFRDETVGRLALAMGECWARQPWSLGFHWFPWQACSDELDRMNPHMVDALCRIARELPGWRDLG